MPCGGRRWAHSIVLENLRLQFRDFSQGELAATLYALEYR